MVAILVVLTILVCLSIDAIIQKRRALATAAQVVLPQAKASWAMPARVHVFPGHSWAEMDSEPQRALAVGLDDFLTHALGKIDHIHIRPVGTHLKQGDPMLTIEQNGRHLTLPAPISGEIQAHNNLVLAHPEKLQQTAYGTRWIYALRPTRLHEEKSLLKTGQQARQWLAAEYHRLADWLAEIHAPRLEMAMQDGGLPAQGALTQLDETEWIDFQAQFLNPTTAERR